MKWLASSTSPAHRTPHPGLASAGVRCDFNAACVGAYVYIRRKAEEERMRKEEEKARRELIKQEYLRRKQQELVEEQGVAKPRPQRKKPRPKSLHRGQSGTTTRMTVWPLHRIWYTIYNNGKWCV